MRFCLLRPFDRIESSRKCRIPCRKETRVGCSQHEISQCPGSREISGTILSQGLVSHLVDRKINLDPMNHTNSDQPSLTSRRRFIAVGLGGFVAAQFRCDRALASPLHQFSESRRALGSKVSIQVIHSDKEMSAIPFWNFAFVPKVRFVGALMPMHCQSLSFATGRKLVFGTHTSGRDFGMGWGT